MLHQLEVKSKEGEKMLERRQKWIEKYVYFTMICSSLVLIEPSPYDLLIIVLIMIGFTFSYFQIEERLLFPILVLSAFIICNLLSLYFMTDLFIAIRYSFITFYLIVSWLLLVSLANESLLKVILNGYLISAVITVMIGIAAYSKLLPMSEQFLMFDRVKSTFKDPNVFGPFLVFPALFALSLTELTRVKPLVKVVSFSLFILLVSGIVLSFSRAAWGNFGISFFLYFVILKREFFFRRIKTMIIVLMIGLPFFIYLVQLPFIQELFTSRLMIKNYDSDRFATQQSAIEMGMLNPLGQGPGQSEYVFQYSPHSLYARVFTENGLFGLLSIITLLVASAYRAFKSYWQSTGEYAVIFVIIFSSLIGLIFNSFFIDTLHWRHFWLVLSLAYFPLIKKKEKICASKHEEV